MTAPDHPEPARPGSARPESARPEPARSRSALPPPDLAVLARLEAAIAARRGGDPAVSHSARLLSRGPVKCAQKFGEEAVEAALAAAAEDRGALVAETADVLYHLLVMLASREVTLTEVAAELERREGVSGVTEKAGRQRP